MLKKFVLAALAMFTAAGLTLAATFIVVKADDKGVTLKDAEDKDAKEATYTWGKDVKFSRKGKDGDMTIEKEAALKILTNEKLAGKLKIEATIKDKEVTEVKMMGGKKGK